LNVADQPDAFGVVFLDEADIFLKIGSDENDGDSADRHEEDEEAEPDAEEELKILWDISWEFH